MPEYLAPGVYVEEVSSGIKPIEGVGTSTAGFIGATERGPMPPQFVSSFLEFQRIYGSHVPHLSYLAYAVQGFFENGGRRCFVGRVASRNAVTAANNFGSLRIAAAGPGIWGNNISIEFEEATQAKQAKDDSPIKEIKEWKKITITYAIPDSDEQPIIEQIDDLTHKIGSSNNIVKSINASSNFIRAWWVEGEEIAAPPNGQSNLAGGLDGDALVLGDFVGDDEKQIAVDPTQGNDSEFPPDEELGRGFGLKALATIDEIAILIAPDGANGAYDLDSLRNPLRSAVILQCEDLKDRFAVLSVDQGERTVSDIQTIQDTKYGGVYYPWIKIFDPIRNGLRLIPPVGHVAGIYARTDIERGVHKAPANAVVRGLL